jgi:uncharacterized membrane protein YphA (DoxX/SURF4 family)
MSDVTQPKSKAKIAGWILSVLLVLFLAGVSAPGKFMEFDGKAEMFTKLGITDKVAFYVGIVEIAVAVLFLIPQTAFVAAILLSAYLGGAVWAHARVEDYFFFPMIIGVLIWVALGLRDKRVFEMAFGGTRR